MVGIRGKSFAVAALADAGVKRISLATSLYRAAMTGLLNAAKEVREHLTFGYIDNSLATPEMTRSCASRRLFQVLIVGGGPVGLTAALRCRPDPSAESIALAFPRSARLTLSIGNIAV